MSVSEHAELVDVAIVLVFRAHLQALAEAQRKPESTWIDAVCAIGATQAQLLAAQPGTLPEVPPEGAGRHTCVGLLEQAEQSLARIPPGQGPVSLALIRAYLTDAIVEATGREP